MPQNRLKEDTLNYYKRIKDILSDDTAQDGKYSTKLNLQITKTSYTNCGMLYMMCHIKKTEMYLIFQLLLFIENIPRILILI